MIYPGRNNGNRIMDFLCENITAINYNLSYFCKKNNKYIDFSFGSQVLK